MRKRVLEPRKITEESGLTFTISTNFQRSTAPVESSNGDDFWKPAGTTSRVAGHEIGGMVYIGAGLEAADGYGVEPALINPKERVFPDPIELSTRKLPYWPTYSEASPEARAAYLSWLSTGRKDPSADTGYVFLYFYGLERRALHDAIASPAAKAELPDIEKEVERLLEIYDNGSFQNYATSFLDVIRSNKDSSKLYIAPPPELRSRGLGFSHRLGLAQCAADDQPLPAEWAYAWLIGEPSTRLNTPARRCPDEHKRLFLHRYRELNGQGLKLPRGKIKLRMDYTAASPGFRGKRSGFGVMHDLPDVTTLSAPIKKLQALSDRCCLDLVSYSRSVGRDKAGAGTFGAIVELPASIWPEEYQNALKKARSLSLEDEGTIGFDEFRSWFPGWQEPDRDTYTAICRAMHGLGIGLEPDPRFGGALPEDRASIVLFSTESQAADSTPDSRYAIAALTLHLAVAVASTDGQVARPEQDLMRKHLEEWLHFSAPERQRLDAHMRRLMKAPPKLTGLTKRISTLTKPARESLGNFLATVAQADGEVRPEEVKSLEKIFKLLGLDSQTVYSNIHAAASEPVSIRPAEPTTGGFAIPGAPRNSNTSFRIDPAKVAALRADSERVSALLGTIFVDDEVQAAATVKRDDEKPEQASPDSILGLDAEHSAFLRVLIARTHWSRSELEELARDRGLMLDGALEHINDAAFERHEKPFFEGEDPAEINPDILKEIADGDNKAA